MSAWLFRPFGGTCPFSSRHASRFREPPYDPGRSDFPSPVLTLACPPTAFPPRRRLKCWHTYTPLPGGLHVGLDPSLMVRLFPALSPGPHQGPPGAQRSFARSRCYLSQGGIQHHLRGHYPSFFAHTTSCVRPNTSRRLRSLPWSAGPCRLLPAPAGRGPFPTLSPRVFPWMLGPLPRWSVRCSYPFLPPQHRPSLPYHRSALPQILTQRLLSRTNFRDCSHSVMFGPPSLLTIQVVPTSENSVSRAAMASTSEQNIRRYRRMHRIC